MATAPVLELEPVQSAGTDIVVAVTQNPGIVLLDHEKFDAWYEKLSAEAPTDADVTTNKGRDTLRSFAAKVRSEKAAIDKARLRLTKEWRDMTSQANAAGKEIEERLESLAVEVRKPLTDWEAAETARVNECRAVIDWLREAKIIAEDDTADAVRARGTSVFGVVLDPDRFGEMLAEAQAAKDESIATLKRALARLMQEEADRAELARLRAEREEADRLAAEKAAEEEAERQLAEEHRLAEEHKAAAEKAEAERIAEARIEAAQAAQREADARHAEEIAAERAKLAEAENAAQAERDRVTRGREMLAYIREVVAGRIGGDVQPFGVLLRELESKVVVVGEGYGDMESEIEQARVDGLVSLNDAMKRQGERKRQEEEREAERVRLAEEHERQQNRKHRLAIMGEVKADLMTFGVDEETARKIVTGIVAKTVRHTTVAF